MTAPLPETAKQAVETVAGPRYRPAAYPLLQLAKDAIHGHVMIAERIREHAGQAAADRAAAAEVLAAERAADRAAAAGGR